MVKKVEGGQAAVLEEVGRVRTELVSAVPRGSWGQGASWEGEEVTGTGIPRVWKWAPEQQQKSDAFRGHISPGAWY